MTPGRQRRVIEAEVQEELEVDEADLPEVPEFPIDPSIDDLPWTDAGDEPLDD
jgi:GTP-binding protein